MTGGGKSFRIANAATGRELAVSDTDEVVSVPDRPGRGVQAEAHPGLREVPRGRGERQGQARTGSPTYGEVKGLVEGHMHGMAFEFLGGKAHCGRPGTSTARHTRCATAPTTSRQRLRGDPRERALRQPGPLPRPRGLADLQRLATPRLADPRVALLPLARARVARGPADLREPVRGEPRALRHLSAESRARATRWTAFCARRSGSASSRTTSTRSPAAREGLVPDRPQPVPGAAGDQQGQARRDPGDGGLGAVQLPPGLPDRQRPPATPANIDDWLDSSTARGPPARDHEQVRQRADRRRRRRRRVRGRRSTAANS